MVILLLSQTRHQGIQSLDRQDDLVIVEQVTDVQVAGEQNSYSPDYRRNA